MTLIKVKPGDLSLPYEWDELLETMKTRSEQISLFEIDLESTPQINLPQFNSLIVLYMYQRRLGGDLRFVNYSEPVKKYVEKTRFHHVFSS